MKLFIDFDDVILNTKEFSANLRKFFVEHGINEELLKKYYYRENIDSNVKLFDPWATMDRLEKEEGLDVSKLRINFSELITDISKFVFSDVENFLKKIGKENIYLISFGLPTFQNQKIQACGIDKLVNGCVVTQNRKAQAIEKVISQMEISRKEKIIFIDDRVEQIKDIKITFPDSCTFLLCRNEGRYCDQKNEYCDYEIHDLEEAYEIISYL